MHNVHAARAARDANVAAERAEAERRAACPIEQDIAFIRRHGAPIHRADVDGGPADRWKHNGRTLDADGVRAVADGIRARQAVLAPTRLPPPSRPERRSPCP